MYVLCVCVCVYLVYVCVCFCVCVCVCERERERERSECVGVVSQVVNIVQSVKGWDVNLCDLFPFWWVYA